MIAVTQNLMREGLLALYNYDFAELSEQQAILAAVDDELRRFSNLKTIN
jgi:hypothetical protein